MAAGRTGSAVFVLLLQVVEFKTHIVPKWFFGILLTELERLAHFFLGMHLTKPFGFFEFSSAKSSIFPSGFLQADASTALPLLALPSASGFGTALRLAPSRATSLQLS